MSWLAGWDHRMAWAADSSDTDKVTDDLAKPSIPIFFGATVGISGSYDNTPIFDEIGSNSDEMAITYGDTEELYVEVEDWQSVAETGVVWIGDNTDASWDVISGTDRTGWIYYKDGNPNTDRVAGVGSRTEVWDAGHVSVWHLSEDDTTYKDSTGNNDRTSGTNPDRVAGSIGFGQDFNLSAAEDIVTDNNDDVGNGAYTVEIQCNPDSGSVAPSQTLVGKRKTSTELPFLLLLRDKHPGADLFSMLTVDAATVYASDTTVTPDGSSWYYFVGRYNGSTEIATFVDGTADGTDDVTGHGDWSNTDAFTMGAEENSGAEHYYDGQLDEVRISSVSRANAWIKANFYFQTDDLLYFGSEERLFIPQVMIF